MASNCSFCGVKYKLLNTGIEGFDDEKKRTLCLECFKVFKYKICPEVYELFHEGVEKKEIMDSVISNHSLSESGKNYVSDYIETVIEYENEKNTRLKEEPKQLTGELKKKALEKSKFQKLTTGHFFDGYKITDYKGIISGETVVGTGVLSELLASGSDLFGIESDSFSEKMRTAKELSIEKLKIQSALVEGNAIIGIAFDYITLSNNMIGVSANGTAVVIEKVE